MWVLKQNSMGVPTQTSGLAVTIEGKYVDTGKKFQHLTV